MKTPSRILPLALAAGVGIGLIVLVFLSRPSRDAAPANAETAAGPSSPARSAGDLEPDGTASPDDSSFSNRAPTAAVQSAAGRTDAAPEPLLVPITAGMPRSSYSFGRIAGEVTSASGPIQLREIEGSFAPFRVPDGGPIEVALTIPKTVAGLPVEIAAGDGGLLERTGGPLNFEATGGPLALELSHRPTMGPGRYSIQIFHAGAIATLDYWSGPLPPRAERGPDYVPLPSTTARN